MALLAALLAGGCARRPPPPERLGYLVATHQIPGEFLWRQRVAVDYRGKGGSFQAVVQKADDELLILGLTPVGSRAFVLTQKGTDVEFKSYLDMKLPFPPRVILLDLHRTYFRAMPRAPRPEGWTDLVDGKARLRELWRGGRLLRREYRRDDVDGVMTIDYGAGYSMGTPPPRVLIDNGWYGFRVEIETADARAL